ncbi:MAG: RNA-binding transcriptional accessory protein [Spirochaetales bacterium]|nr:RNA-binding transcriptional accessory protein [Spirochaetales bacterium]
MNKNFIINSITADIGIKRHSVQGTVDLLEGGATIPFIARYRKERTDGLDETEIRAVFDKYEYYFELEKRKDTILRTIEAQGKLTKDLEKKITECTDRTKLEDIYLPYKPKKRTRATIAKEKGLEPLAILIYSQESLPASRDEVLQTYVNPGKGVRTGDEALAGAMDIIAEWISDEEYLRGWIRDIMKKKGILHARVKPKWREKKTKYLQYYDFQEDLASIPSHRLLAIRRGTAENILSWKIDVGDTHIIDFIRRMTVKKMNAPFAKEITDACEDSFRRLICPSMEKEVFCLKSEDSEKEAIRVFSTNLKNLLLASPAGSCVVMGIDPGYRTGCKIALINKNGDLLEYSTIYPFAGKSKRDEAVKTISELVLKHNAELIAIGNGTASRETDDIVRESIQEYGLSVHSLVISEAGASVYSASSIAKEEFPDMDVTVRGAVSIGRRLQDPLAELVKIDPKSIGVGQYQHDVNQKELKRSLDYTVESCVNYVGVELNTASIALLSYVSGINRGIAENIVLYRSQNGHFKNRSELMQVDKLGPRSFEQCAGFLRIRDSGNPLDNSGIHPETYTIVEQMAVDADIPVAKLIRNKEVLSKIDLKRYVAGQFGLPTLKDIIKELKKPGLDPRKEFSSVQFSSQINKLEDLSDGLILSGTVTNVTNFGAFVDIGVHQDGLIHISRLCSRFVRDPYEIVSVGDVVRVKVLGVDIPLKRISLERIEE